MFAAKVTMPSFYPSKCHGRLLARLKTFVQFWSGKLFLLPILSISPLFRKVLTALARGLYCLFRGVSYQPRCPSLTSIQGNPLRSILDAHYHNYVQLHVSGTAFLREQFRKLLDAQVVFSFQCEPLLCHRGVLGTAISGILRTYEQEGISAPLRSLFDRLSFLSSTFEGSARCTSLSLGTGDRIHGHCTSYSCG